MSLEDLSRDHVSAPPVVTVRPNVLDVRMFAVDASIRWNAACIANGAGVDDDEMLGLVPKIERLLTGDDGLPEIDRDHLIRALRVAANLLAQGRLARQADDEPDTLDTTTAHGRARVEWAAGRDNLIPVIGSLITQLERGAR